MKKLDDILLEAGVLTEDQVQKARQEKAEKGQGIAAHLVQLGFISEVDLIKTLSRKLRLPILNLANIQISEKILTLFPSDSLYDHHLVPVAMRKIDGKKNLIIAMSDPTNDQTKSWLKKYIPYEIRPGIASERMIRATLVRHKIVSSPKEEGSEKPAAGAISMVGEEERTESVSMRVKMNEEGEDGEPTQWSRIDGDLRDEDEAILRGLTEPSFHGTRGEIPRVEALGSPEIPEKKIDKEEVSKALENLPLPVIFRNFGQKSNENDLFEVIIQLLVEQKLISLKKLQGLINRMK